MVSCRRVRGFNDYGYCRQARASGAAFHARAVKVPTEPPISPHKPAQISAPYGKTDTMISWLLSLLGLGERKTTPAARAASATAGPAGTAMAIGAAEALCPAASSLCARRPMLNREGQLAGFDFRIPGLDFRLGPPCPQHGGGRRAEEDVQAAQAVQVLSAMAPVIASGRVALTALPLPILGRPEVTAAVPAGAMLLLTDAPFGRPDAAVPLNALRNRGARLGTANGACIGADFVVIDGGRLSLAQIRQVADACHRSDPLLQLVAVDLGNIDDLQAALDTHIDLGCGRVDQFAAPPSDAALLPPRLQRVCQLINRVVANEDGTALAADLRADVDLSYQVLAYANSPLLGLSQAVESVEQAVMLLGRDELYRWLTMLLVAGADQQRASRALREIALMRARLLETLAVRASQPTAALFTTGLMSMIDVMLKIPMANALEPLNVAPATREALVDHSGPWRPYMELVIALEQSDIATAERLAEAFGGIQAVTWLADDAWQWAVVSASMSGPQVQRARTAARAPASVHA